MYSAADKISPDAAPGSDHVARWEAFPLSHLGHHGRECCDIARHWLRAMDFAQLNGGELASGPRWVREKYEWGPSQWPLHWCEALDAEVIDCGAHAALAHDVFEARGLTALRAQIVQGYGARAVDQWRRRWAADDASNHWLAGGVIYHEANAVLVGDGAIRLWDGSAALWLNPLHTGGYGGVLAVRLAAPDGWRGPAILQWGEHHIALDAWQRLDA